jgi:hypothetical protein
MPNTAGIPPPHPLPNTPNMSFGGENLASNGKDPKTVENSCIGTYNVDGTKSKIKTSGLNNYPDKPIKHKKHHPPKTPPPAPPITPTDGGVVGNQNDGEMIDISLTDNSVKYEKPSAPTENATTVSTIIKMDGYINHPVTKTYTLFPQDIPIHMGIEGVFDNIKNLGGETVSAGHVSPTKPIMPLASNEKATPVYAPHRDDLSRPSTPKVEQTNTRVTPKSTPSTPSPPSLLMTPATDSLIKDLAANTSINQPRITTPLPDPNGTPQHLEGIKTHTTLSSVHHSPHISNTPPPYTTSDTTDSSRSLNEDVDNLNTNPYMAIPLLDGLYVSENDLTMAHMAVKQATFTPINPSP